MFNKILAALVIGLMSVGCVSAGSDKGTVTFDDLLTFTSDKLAEVGVAVNTANANIANMGAELEEARSTITTMEKIVGPADTNEDGVISTKEGEDFATRIATSTDPGAQNPDNQSETYKALGLLLIANGASRKLGHKLPPQLQWITALLGSPTKTKT